ncbi:CTP-dependent riboflavin kinase (plasmid) [Haloterrigena turkmenica DSM 5511]|uniref:Riboflavin kinase n=1 Tax=Haloterrigena turkmenica (strain ATCC 51198 / DSM 5511 / JCM 9101 / NCIMB 13204 / VKM B-1734 / 4k) TaxID=543526 RepID=D2RZZ2_HALTV|nr:DUF120 domain-containing protein [Haloterrigena turkmenica]ADB62689.1 CTP-dependent riboflavin kinase [Haloterrigena turkmenica DSM 5511]
MTRVEIAHRGELTVLKLLALEGGLDRDVKTTCPDLGADLDAAGLVERETVSDGQWVAITEAGEQSLRSEYGDYQRIFDSEADVELRGTLTSGIGEGQHYVSLTGYARQFRDRLDYEPHPGTLNVALDDDSIRRRSALSGLDPIPIDGWEGDDRTYGSAFCYPVTIETDDGATCDAAYAIVPKRTHHEEDQLEIIAPTKLRTDLEIADDDPLIIHVEEN